MLLAQAFSAGPLLGTLVHFHFQLQRTTYLELNPHLESEQFPQDKFLDMGLLGLRVCPLYPSQKAERHLPSTPSPTHACYRQRELVWVGVWPLVKLDHFYVLDHLYFLHKLLVHFVLPLSLIDFLKLISYVNMVYLL